MDHQLFRKFPFLISILYALCCTGFQVVVVNFSKTLIPGFLKLNDKLQKTWYNKAVSSLHAIIMILLTSYYWIYYVDDVDSLLSLPPTKPYSKTGGEEKTIVYIMCGYILYDTYFEIFQSPNPTDIAIILHHIIGFISHLSTLITQNKAALFYCMVVYIAEISTPFLNISWLLHNLDQSKSLIFTIFSLLLLITFFIRTCVGPFALFHMIRFKSEWGDYNNDYSLNWMFYGNFVVIFFFSSLNLFWFYKLLQMAFGSKKSKKAEKKV